MGGILTLLLVLVLSITITRISAIALTYTGLSRQSAKFQARSAFTGVGFTTSESETVVNHPLRRKILMILMVLGNVGVVTGMSSLIVSFIGKQDDVDLLLKLGVLLGGSILLWFLAGSRVVEKGLGKLMGLISKDGDRLRAYDYNSLLHLSGEYTIAEIGIEENHWLAGKKLANSKLRDEGINVLGINRTDGTYLGTPGGDTEIHQNDSLIVYGRSSTINKLEQRERGLRGSREHLVEKNRQQKRSKQEESSQ